MVQNIVVIAGGTGSGKSTLANALARQLDASILRVDDYYRPLDHLTFAERESANFDCPGAIDHEFLLQQVSLLMKGRSVQKPIYDFSKHTRAIHGEEVHATKTLIIEGLFALYWPEFCQSELLKVFVDTPYHVRFERRLKRDIEERGRDREEVTRRFQTHVNPMHIQYIEPTRAQADLLVDGTSLLDDTLRILLDHPMLIPPRQSLASLV